MIILGIDTSCDDTAVSLLEIKNNKLAILSNEVSSQINIHKKYGGVFPTLAKREHQKNILPVLTKALKEASLLRVSRAEKKKENGKKKELVWKILEKDKELANKTEKFLASHKIPNIDYIAVTVGPGLDPCLWIGINFAKAISAYWKKPLVPINHLEGHILSVFLPKTDEKESVLKIKKEIKFPAISLVVSGGHTQLILMKSFKKYRIIGETRDDAAGECFDKVARILGLGYPGGPIISKKAAEKCLNCPEVKLPRPMIHSKDFDFSFSGLKTAVLYKNKEVKRKTENYIKAMAREAEKAIVDVLVSKTMSAAEKWGAKTIILGGGVSANNQLRDRLKEECQAKKIKFLLPERKYSTDNGAMVALSAYFERSKAKKNLSEIIKVKSMPNLRLK